MSDTIPDTQPLGQAWCPTCEPDRNPLTEILDIRPCHRHPVSYTGPDDEKADTAVWLNSGSEADGHDCREIQRMIS